MSSLKEQDGRYYQECRVARIATEKTIQPKDIVMKNHLLCQAKIITLSNVELTQHLYITSNEEIKEGDWFIIDNVIKQCIGFNQHYIITKDINGILPIGCKKIIATTDEELRINSTIRESDFMLLDYGKTLSIIAKPSQSFIKKYIEEYNKGNQITDVLVEYETAKSYSGNSGLEIKSWLKLDSDNTITIKKVKDSYSREEVYNLLIDLWAADLNKRQEIEDWIKENL